MKLKADEGCTVYMGIGSMSESLISPTGKDRNLGLSSIV